MSFSSLKKQSSLGSLTSKLVKEIEKTSTTRGGADERLWKPELDKTGNGYAVVRFLPAPDGEDLPWQKYIHMLSKVLEDGTSRTLLPRLVARTQCLSTIVICGTVVTILTRMLYVDRSVSFLTTVTSMS